MELKLRRNDHKLAWRDKPAEALLRLMLLAIDEFRVAHDFFPVQESRPKLVDAVNFAMMLWDRLGVLDQDAPAGVQVSKGEDTK